MSGKTNLSGSIAGPVTVDRRTIVAGRERSGR
jgi:hypothetical protein